MFIIDFDDTLFDTHALKKILAQSRQPEEKELRELLFSDALSFLRYLKTVKQKLILLSFGDFSFQSKKINASGIAKFFDEIIITPDGKEDAIEKILENHYSRAGVVEKEAWFINDKIEETKKVIQEFPKLKPILKMSPRWPEEEYKLSLMPCFDTLTQIQSYVAKQLE